MKPLTNNLFLSFLFVFCVFTTTMSFKGAESSVTADDEIKLKVTTKAPTSLDKLDGRLSIVVLGGKPPYKLFIVTSTRVNPIELTGESFDLVDLAKGFYVVTIKDATGKLSSEIINL